MTASPIDFVALAKRMHEERVKMIHHEGTGLHGWEFDAEVLRRALGYSANDGTDGRRQVPYETVRRSTGLITDAEHRHLLDGHTIIDRLNREAAEKRAEEARAEARATIREAAQRIADHIRGRCNERAVPAKFRREGVLLAADWVDPRVPKDRYGNLLPAKADNDA